MDVQEHAVVISIDASSRVSVNNDQLNVSEVRSKLPTLLDVARTQEVYLKADKSLPYGVVMDVIAQIKDAGIEKIGMVTEPASAEQQVRR